MKHAKYLVLAVFLGGLLAPPFSADESGSRPIPAQRVSFALTYTLVPGDKASEVTLTSLVPRSLPGRQKILSVNYSPQPEQVFEKDGTAYARFVLPNLARPVEIRIDVEAELYRCDLSLASSRPRTGKPEPQAALDRWLTAEKYIENDAPEIRAAAREVTGKTDVEIVRSTLRVVRKSLRYSGFSEKDVGALGGLKAGRGDCTEFSDLFVALCRARNIPARVWEGYLTSKVAAGDTPQHSWAEVYLQDYGWVRFDPLHSASGKTPLDRLRPIYIHLSDVRNDPVLHGYHTYRYVYRGSGLRVRSTFVVNRREIAPRR